MTSRLEDRPSATERFLARLGSGREEFLRAHFAAAWGSGEDDGMLR